MKYPYKVEYLAIGSKQVPVLRLPKEIELVTAFLFSDVQSGGVGDFYVSEIDLVLQGKALHRAVGGNAFVVEIKKDFTKLIHTLRDDEDGHECLIETTELRELIEIWLDIRKD
jgi:hypothetical protein